MRISLLEKRENFEKILKETLISSSFFEKKQEFIERKYYINKYLNFIATNKLPENVFQILVNEYSSSLSWWKKGIQFLYVKFAIFKFFRALFSHQSIKLPVYFEHFLILGGNHRLRLFSVNLKSSIVLLKQGEREGYIKNDIAVRTENSLTYAPQLLKFGKDWLEEEYFEGIPINRVDSPSKVKEQLENIFEYHFKTLILNNLRSYKKNDYLDLVNAEIDFITTNKKIKVDQRIIKEIKNVFSLLFSKLNNNDIKVSWTHGDFQQANILIANGISKVIDWEASEKRFYMYDAFILFGMVREGESLSDAIRNFKEAIKHLNYIHKVDENTITLLLIEDLRFNVNEMFSVNFFESGIQIASLCKSITTYIDEQKNHFI